MPDYKRPESILVVVHAPGPSILLLKRLTPADFWQSVTGSLEHGETPAAAARRELDEETGLTSDDLVSTGVVNQFTIHPDWRDRYAPEVTENTEHVFTLTLDHQPPIRLNPREHSAYRWLRPAEATALARSRTDRAAIRRLTGTLS